MISHVRLGGCISKTLRLMRPVTINLVLKIMLKIRFLTSDGEGA